MVQQYLCRKSAYNGNSSSQQSKSRFSSIRGPKRRFRNLDGSPPLTRAETVNDEEHNGAVSLDSADGDYVHGAVPSAEGAAWTSITIGRKTRGSDIHLEELSGIRVDTVLEVSSPKSTRQGLTV